VKSFLNVQAIFDTLKSLAFVFNAETLAFRQKNKSKIEELLILIHRKWRK
jgi:hypothetical protein